MIFAGGKVAGVSCPACQFESRDVDLPVYTFTGVFCPECDSTILSEAQKSELRRANMLCYRN